MINSHPMKDVDLFPQGTGAFLQFTLTVNIDGELQTILGWSHPQLINLLNLFMLQSTDTLFQPIIIHLLLWKSKHYSSSISFLFYDKVSFVFRINFVFIYDNSRFVFSILTRTKKKSVRTGKKLSATFLVVRKYAQKVD
jgi:hypothetical protein